jgi:hypothetical protein
MMAEDCQLGLEVMSWVNNRECLGVVLHHDALGEESLKRYCNSM